MLNFEWRKSTNTGTVAATILYTALQELQMTKEDMTAQ